MAQQLWDDPDLLEIVARSVAEPRWLVMGKIEGKHWSAIVTYRNDTVRLISVRRSRRSEVLKYEKNYNRRV